MRKLTKEEVVSRFTKIHGDKYDYTDSIYYGMKANMRIFHKDCGRFFEQTPDNHLKGKRCTFCYGNLLKTTEQFIKESKAYNGFDIDYSKTIYRGEKVKAIFICPIHGEFERFPEDLLSKRRPGGCPKCGFETIRRKKLYSFEKFKEKAQRIHGQHYEYMNYEGANKEIDLICPIHGSFSILASKHLQGQGCSLCRASKLENEIRDFLNSHHLKFKEQYKTQWLGLQSLDFYLPEYKIGIECQGEQHFTSKKFFGGEDGLNDNRKRDKIKLKKCNDNGVKLLYFSNLGINYPYPVFEDKEKLLEAILNNKKEIE